MKNTHKESLPVTYENNKKAGMMLSEDGSDGYLI
jgi:hypothetical protein